MSDVFCKYCDKKLSEEKGELAHGRLTCHYAPWVDTIDQLRATVKALAIQFHRMHDIAKSEYEFYDDQTEDLLTAHAEIINQCKGSV